MFLCFGGGSLFVAAINLLFPILHLGFAFALYKPLRKMATESMLSEHKEVTHPCWEAEPISYWGDISDDCDECVISFPGKFSKAWDLCISGHHAMSVGCVFFVREEDGYGRHSDPCMCYQLYGKRPPKDFGYKVDSADKEEAKAAWNNFIKNQGRPEWGCKWFENWRWNVETARDNYQRLVVYYFPDEVEDGEVDWDEISHTELWDSIGLGGSQKGEVAWLEKMNYDFERKDVSELFEMLDSFRM